MFDLDKAKTTHNLEWREEGLNEAINLSYLSSYFIEQVVLLNQVTTKFTEGSFQLTLALGQLFIHTIIIPFFYLQIIFGCIW